MPLDHRRLGMPVTSLPKGIAFTRLVLAQLRTAKHGLHAAAAYADEQCARGGPWSNSPQVATVLRAIIEGAALDDPFGRSPEGQSRTKAAIDAGDTSDSTWAAPLIYAQQSREFIEFLRPLTIIGRLRCRPIPFNTRVPRIATGSTGGWAGESTVVPVASLAIDVVTLGFFKMSLIIVLTNELFRFSDPSAELLVRDELARAIAAFEDQQFIDPSVAAVANTNPASVTHSAPSIASTGSSVAQITADVRSLFALADAANIGYAGGAFVMAPRTAAFLSTALTTGGTRMWPEISPRGGQFFGLPVIVSQGVPVEAGSPNSTIIALVDAEELFVADDGQVTIDVSSQAALQMSSTPSSGAQNQVSLFQTSSTALRANRFCSWTRRHDAGVILLQGVSY